MGQRVRQVNTIVSSDGNCFDRLNNLFGNASDASYELNRRAWLETAPQSPILIYDCVHAATLWIHHHNRPSVMSESLNRRFAYFQILAGSIVFGYIGFSFVAHAFIDCALASDRRLAGSFGTTP